jgi:signal transduction histidine kinase
MERSVVRDSAMLAPGSHVDAVFAGDGEMAARCRAVDWAATALGPVHGWTHALRTTVGLVLASRNPMFLWWGPDLVQVYNDAYRPSLGDGGRHPRALGARGREFWTDIWETIRPQIDQVMGGGPAVWHEDLFLPIERNGRLEDVWWTYSYTPVRDDDGAIAGILVVCMETTQRVLSARRQEALLRELEIERARLTAVFEQAPAFIALLRGPEHVFEMANAEYYRVVGHRELLGRPAVEALPEIRGQGFIELLDGVLATGEAYVGREMPIQFARTPGAVPEARFCTFVYQPLVEADGTRSGVFVHGVDITESVQARRDVEAARSAAEQANLAKSEFLANMSHELRTPLNAIAGYAQLIGMGVHGPITEAQREALGRIERAERHLLRLVNDVLNFARLESGRVEYDVAPVRLAEVVAELEPMVAPQLREKGLAFTTDVPDDCVVRADREKLAQVLLNLVSNAIKFTPSGGRISVGCAARRDGTEPAGQVHVRVSDTGVGIPDQKHQAIFEPFVQVDTSTAGRASGTGLGLAISRDLARGMGGDLRVRSAVGEGSAFTVTLPAADTP